MRASARNLPVLFRILAAVAFAAGLGACASGQKGDETNGSNEAAVVASSSPKLTGQRKLVIVGINDTHGYLLSQPPPQVLKRHTTADIGGAEWFAGYLKAIREDARKNNGDVILLDGGDIFQGTMISNQFQGKSTFEVYNALGVTAAAIGNHEFDFGLQVLKDRMAQAKFPLLSANIFLKGTVKLGPDGRVTEGRRPDWIKPSVLVEVAGVKVGIIGLTTIETPITTNPANLTELDFVPAGPVGAQEAEKLALQGATVILVTAHIGPFAPDNEIQKVAKAMEGKCHGIVSGHHHTGIGPPPLIEHNIPIVQSYSKLGNFSTIELTVDEQGRPKQFAVNEGTYPRPGGPQPIFHLYDGLPPTWRGMTVSGDPQVAALIKSYDIQVQKLREEKIGETQAMLEKGGRDDLLANLASDALRSGAGGGLKADFAFQNSGGLRIPEIPVGSITFGQVFDLYPFDNQQIVVTLPAQQVRAALEAILRHGKGPLKVSGLRYVVDWEKFGAGRNPKNAPPGAIVTEIYAEDGKPVCVTKSCSATECAAECSQGTYTVSVTDFLANGGDGLVMLKDAPKQVGNVLARDIIVAFVKEKSPLNARLLGAVSQGAQPRVTQIGRPVKAE